MYVCKLLHWALKTPQNSAQLSFLMDSLSTWTVAWRGATSTSAVDKLSVRTDRVWQRTQGCTFGIDTTWKGLYKKRNSSLGRCRTLSVRDVVFLFRFDWFGFEFFLFCNLILNAIACYNGTTSTCFISSSICSCTLHHCQKLKLIFDNVGMHGMRIWVTVKWILKKWPECFCARATHAHTGSN